MAGKKRDTRGRVRTVKRSIAALRRAGYNPRRITEKAKAGLRTSMARFGVVQPPVVNKRSAAKGWPEGSEETIVGGHQRIAILEEDGVREVDVVVVDLDPTEEKALNVALNSTKIAGAFTEGLGSLLQEIKLKAPDLHSALLMPGMKAGAAELDQAAGKSLEAIDEASLQKKARTRVKPGDVWLLGDHRLVCGDATVPDVVAAAMNGHLADLVHTDPPYGVAYEAPSGQFDVIAGDELSRDDLVALLRGSLELAVRHASDQAAFYVWHASATREDFAFAMKAVGLEERQYLIWAKPQIVLGRADYQWSHEPCFYSCKAGSSPKWYGDRSQPTVWRVAARTDDGPAVVLGPGLVVSDGDGHEVAVLGKIPKRKLRTLRVPPGEAASVFASSEASTVWELARDPGKPVHPTQKPVALAARAVLNSSPPDGHVLDLFGGGGSTLLACEQLGRVAHVVELEAPYCDAIVARWEQLTGRKAKKAPKRKTR